MYLIITTRPKSFQNSVTVETGLSDFHKMTLAVMKVFYNKRKRNIVTYRNYKHFSNKAFMFVEVKNGMTSEDNDLEFDRFNKTAHDEAIQRYAPIKNRYVRVNQAPFTNKKIKKDIMKRSPLRNKVLNKKCDTDKKAYNKQRSFCVSLIRSAKKNVSNINTSDITDNETFWKMVRSFFTNKIKTKSKITLIEKKNVSQEGQ